MRATLPLFLLLLPAGHTLPSTAVPEADDCQTQGLSMLQSRSDRRQRPKPWETRRFYGISYHKCGSQLLMKVIQRAMVQLGADINKDVCALHDNVPEPRILFGIQAPEILCQAVPPDAQSHQIRFNTGMSSRMWAAERSEFVMPKDGYKMVVEVRDPTDWLASFYCYHHAGNEFGYNPTASYNPPIPWPEIMSMGPKEGVIAVSGQLFGEMNQALSLLESPGLDYLEIGFEELTRSSADFDRTVYKVLKYLLGDMVSDEQIREAANSTIPEDLNRGLIDVGGHEDDPDCMDAARAAQKEMPQYLQDLMKDYRRRFKYA